MVLTTSLRCCILIVLLVLTSNSAHVSAIRKILYTNESLHVGDRLRNDDYTLKMQENCNLVLRDHSRVIWSTGTAGRGSSCFAKMRDDGNLVVYNYNGQVALWATNTVRGKDQYQLKLKRNRNLVILKGAAREVIWSANTYVTEDMHN
ncbi:Bulb-type lectin domain-containing protein [Heracleum sosnowskyi]|uniref:Bulb-type lectin domain-containing protein n=1 Tax=Heracleum sosnowskyi TaxID=360622 RepID=A0AAD8MGI7_9APIA|nr:Bulb-type lectin domain-containing protein [Heracleum sosnowskyi]